MAKLYILFYRSQVYIGLPFTQQRCFTNESHLVVLWWVVAANHREAAMIRRLGFAWGSLDLFSMIFPCFSRDKSSNTGAFGSFQAILREDFERHLWTLARSTEFILQSPAMISHDFSKNIGCEGLKTDPCAPSPQDLAKKWQQSLMSQRIAPRLGWIEMGHPWSFDGKLPRSSMGWFVLWRCGLSRSIVWDMQPIAVLKSSKHLPPIRSTTDLPRTCWAAQPAKVD